MPGQPIVGRSIGRRGGPLAFGKYPISKKMGPRYFAASATVVRIIGTRSLRSEADLADISEAKGMYNRVLRQDCPDWEAVRHLLGEPDRAVCHLAATWLAELRRMAKAHASLEQHLDKPIARGIAAVMLKAHRALDRAGFY